MVLDRGLDRIGLTTIARAQRRFEARELGAGAPMIVQRFRRGRDLVLIEHRYPPGYLQNYSITIFVSGPSRRNSCSIADFVIDTQPAVGEKFWRARCKNTALPWPAMRGWVLWSIST